MAWLDEAMRRGQELLGYAQLARFEFDGRGRILLMDRQRGIRKPVGWSRTK